MPIHLAIYKYGLENFSIDIIEECPPEILNEKEKYWIKYYNSYKKGYNATEGGQGGDFKGKPVLAYDLQGNYIKRFKNAKTCAEELGLAVVTVYSVLKQRRKSCKGL